ncbi:MAG: hypothetical protein OEM01_13125 [Desulfobulbaceae bacterium]|nr:hypothetical protein [Desulfobulbaceae bacterium]
MKNTCFIVFLALIFGLISHLAMGEEASPQQGETLFNDPKIGGSTNPESCGTCHPGGKGLEESWVKSDLAEMINFCIERPLKGKKLDVNSVEMKSLIMYMKSLDK